MSVTYVYALMDASSHRGARHPRTLRVLGRTIRLRRIGDVYAAIEERAGPPELSEAALRFQHQVVVALARRFEALLPVRFGASVHADELARLIAARRIALQRGFDLVRGREQMTVRIFGSERAEPVSGPLRTGSEYLRRRRLGARALVPAGGQRIRRAVKGMVEQERLDPGRGHVLVTLHHLVARGLADEYRSRVRLAFAGPPRREQVVVSGPWPPFAFTPDVWP